MEHAHGKIAEGSRLTPFWTTALITHNPDAGMLPLLVPFVAGTILLALGGPAAAPK